MRRFLVFASVVFGLVGVMLWSGGQPERRYDGAACQYQMIFHHAPERGMGLVTLGGSRLRVSTNARQFNAVLAEMQPDAVPMHNLSHSDYTLEKEYILLRDLLEQHTPKTVVVMIEPRGAAYGVVHPDYVDIARLSDIPLTIATLWPESRIGAIKAARDILLAHLEVFNRVGDPHRDTTPYDCDQRDYRLNVPALDEAAQKYDVARASQLNWDVGALDHAGFRRWMQAYRDISNASGTEVIFLLITGTSEPLPAPDFAAQFEAAFGLPLIVMDRDLHARLARMGNRDNHHMTPAGRAVFLPWLVDQIEQTCRRADGCF